MLLKICQTMMMLVAIPISYILYEKWVPIKINLNYLNIQQNEIKNSGPLLNSQHQLVEAGWSRQPLKQFKSDDLPLHIKRLRLKKWDHYTVIDSNIYLSLTLADLGYSQNIQVTLYTLQNGSFLHKDQLVLPLLHEKFELYDEEILTQNKRIQSFNSTHLNFSVISQLGQDKLEEREINIELNHKETNFVANLRLKNNLKEDRIVTVTPINRKRTQFFYNQKAYNWVAKGTVQVNDSKLDILESTSNAGMDWGRGVWNYHTYWFWASAMGFENGQRIGINLGGGFQDNNISNATEEAFIYQRKLRKLSDLVYIFDENQPDKHIIVKTHDIQRSNFKLKMPESDNNEIPPTRDTKPRDFYCEIVPYHLNKKNTDIILVSVQFQQILGMFYGAYVLESGEIVEFQEIFGIVEFNKAKW